MRIEEKEFIKFIKKKYNKISNLVDVGANLGKYSDYFDENIQIDKIFLFEPIESCYEQIKIKSNYNKFNIAIGSKKGTSIFYEAKGKESHSSIVNRKWLYNIPSYEIVVKNVNIDTLDNLINEKINVLKIDTEGFELEVLKGSEKLLQENKIDYIQFEYGGAFKDNNIKLNDVINFLKKYDYGVYKFVNQTFELIEDYKDDYEWINFYAKKIIK